MWIVMNNLELGEGRAPCRRVFLRITFSESGLAHSHHEAEPSSGRSGAPLDHLGLLAGQPPLRSFLIIWASCVDGGSRTAAPLRTCTAQLHKQFMSSQHVGISTRFLSSSARSEAPRLILNVTSLRFSSRGNMTHIFTKGTFTSRFTINQFQTPHAIDAMLSPNGVEVAASTPRAPARRVMTRRRSRRSRGTRLVCRRPSQ